MAPARGRQVTPVEQTQVVVNEVVSALRTGLIDWSKRKTPYNHAFYIPIRDGLVQKMDERLTAKADEPVNEPFPTEDEIGHFVRKVERWLLKCLHNRLMLGFHGSIEVLVALVAGKIHWEPTITRQHKFEWSA